MKPKKDSVRGVFYCKLTGLYAARIMKNGTRYYLGRHKTERAAGLAVMQARIRLAGGKEPKGETRKANHPKIENGKITFGKHYGKTVGYVRVHHPQWFGWALENVRGFAADHETHLADRKKLREET